MKRINGDNEDLENDYYRQEEQTLSIVYEHKFLFEEIDTLLNISCELI